MTPDYMRPGYRVPPVDEAQAATDAASHGLSRADMLNAAESLRRMSEAQVGAAILARLEDEAAS